MSPLPPLTAGRAPQCPAQQPRSPLAAVRLATLLLATLALAACALRQPGSLKPGQAESDVLAAMGTPTGRYPLADGARRLEFAQGPAGLQTWMVDLDARGRVTQVNQVMSHRFFEQVRDGMGRDELLRLLGRPAARHGEWQGRETWSWRYLNYDCLWLRVTLLPDGTVWGGAATLPDPACDDQP